MKYNFLTNGTIFDVLKPFFEDVFLRLGKDITKGTIYDFNYIIFNYDKLPNYYVANEMDTPLLTLFPTAFSSSRNFNLSLYNFLSLVNKMLTLHHNSFNIDYSKTCMSDTNIQIDTSILIENNSLIFTENLYCEYDIDNSDPIVLLMLNGSFDKDTKNIIYIYNVCSDTKNISKTKKRTKDIFSEGIETISNMNPSLQFMVLFVEQNNPSFSKAFSLYYGNGFMPVINTLETENINILSRAIGCFIPNDICNYSTISKMLMIKQYNSNFYDNYGEGVIEINKPVKRGNKFYDSTLAFSYRCYCILDNYFTQNILTCQSFMENLSELFYINNKENTLVKNKFSYNYFDNINSYIVLAQNNRPNYKFIEENVDLFRIIGTTNTINKTILSLDDFFDKLNPPNGNRVKTSKYRIRTSIIELFTGNFAFEVELRGLDQVYRFNYDNGGIGYSPNYTSDKKLLEYTVKSIIQNIKQTINLDLGLKNDTVFTFLPCTFGFDSKIDSSKNIGHAVSFVHDNDNKILYFYDPGLISDRRTNEHKHVLKLLRKFVSELMIENGRSVSKYDDLSRYTDGQGNNLYCKIQQIVVDDPLSTLCVLMSSVPYICLQFVKDYDPSKTKKQLQFYMWFLFFSAVIYRQKKIDGGIEEMEITKYQSNLIIVFPYIFIGVYNIIKDMLDDKVNSGTMLTQEDIKLRDEMSRQTESLSQNLINAMTDINSKVYSTNEIPSKYL